MLCSTAAISCDVVPCGCRDDGAALCRLGELLAASTHAPLRALLHAVVLPCAAAVLRLAVLMRGSSAGAQPAATQGALGSRSGPSSGLGSDAEVEQQRGRAWALLGLLRLHLALPPPGADPAAKRALKAAHLAALAEQELAPELQARPALGALAQSVGGA